VGGQKGPTHHESVEKIKRPGHSQGCPDNSKIVGNRRGTVRGQDGIEKMASIKFWIATGDRRGIYKGGKISGGVRQLCHEKRLGNLPTFFVPPQG